MSEASPVAYATDTTDLILRPAVGARGPILLLSPAARKRFSQGSLDLIASRNPDAFKDGDPRPFMGLLELSTELALNPITGQIWLVKFNGKWQVMVGRDGYLEIARRAPDFLSCDGGVHRVKDTFETEYDPEKGWKVTHKASGGISARGDILGAWALLRRNGRPDAYFYADRGQYDKGKNAWATHPDAMILKCPTSYLLRTAYGISGPMPADEVEMGWTPDTKANGSTGPAPAAPQQVSDGIPDELLALLRRAKEIDPKRWIRREIAARIVPVAMSVDGNRESIAEITAEVTAWLSANKIVDAQIVPEQPTAEAEPTAPDAEPTPAGDREQLQHRFDTDAKWSGEVKQLLHRREDLSFALEEDRPAQEGADIAAELDTVEKDLSVLGVPSDWFPNLSKAA